MSEYPLPQYLDQVDSTHTHIKQQLLDGNYTEQAVWAKEQTAGRGRLGRTWLSPQGGLYISLCTTLSDCPPTWFGFAMGLAAQRVLSEYAPRITLKWPNDLLAQSAENAEEQKLGGILAELVSGITPEPYAIIGLGANINTQITLTDTTNAIPPTSLYELTHSEHPVQAIAEAITREAFREFTRLKNTGMPLSERRDLLLQKWESVSSTIGKHVRVHAHGQPVQGKVLGLTEDFALRLETVHQGIQIVQAGDCFHLRVQH